LFNTGDRVVVPVKGVIVKRRSKAEMTKDQKKRFDISLEGDWAEADSGARDMGRVVTKDYEINEVQCYACEVSPALRDLADRVISRMPDLWFIDEWVGRENIAYVLSYEPRKVRAADRMVHADCRKVKPPFRAFMDYQYIITVYEPNVAYMSEAQLALLMWHELKHIPMSGSFVPHDIADFSAIIEGYGIDWSVPDADIPNILAGDEVDTGEGGKIKG
jgi:hypothetical protein